MVYCVDMGFSDEEQDPNGNITSKSPPKDKNLDLLTMLLDDGYVPFVEYSHNNASTAPNSVCIWYKQL